MTGLRALIVAAVVLVAWQPRCVAAEDGAPASPVPSPAARADDTAAPGAVVDTAASAAREAEFERTPRLPEVFIHQWRYETPHVGLPRVPDPEARVARLTLLEAVHRALEHNPGIAAERLAPLSARQAVRNAEATFDPTFSLTVRKDRRESPNASELFQVDENLSNNVDTDVGLRKTLRTGGELSLDFTNNRFSSNAAFQALVPQYTSELQLSLNQPLLRNFGLNFAYLLVDVTVLDSEVARYRYRAALADFVTDVVRAYWAVVFARQNLVVQRQSLELATETLRENQERVRVGLLAPVAVKEAESQAALREEQVIVAENALDNALRTLRRIVYLQPEDATVPLRIDPIETPPTTAVAVEVEEALEDALADRPEILAQNFALRSKNLTVRIRENQLLPRLDFVGSVGLNGLSGEAVVGRMFGDEPIPPSAFDGSYGDGLDRLGSTDFYSFEAGVELEIPLGNAAAKSEYAQAKIDASRTELERRQLVSDVMVEVATAVNDVRTNQKRIESARVARELAEENLRNQQKRLEVGIATTKDVLDFQDDLTQARGLEVQAATDFAVSLAELARARGRILDEYAVVIEEPGERFVPWWARF